MILSILQLAVYYSNPCEVRNCPHCGEPYPIYMYSGDNWNKLAVRDPKDPNFKRI